MKSLPPLCLFSPNLFPPREPGQFALNWLRVGSNAKGNYVEVPFARPPPVVLWNVSQFSFAKSRPEPRAHARDGVARVTADDVGYAAAERIVFCKRGRKAAVKDLRIRGSMVDGDAEQAGHLGVPA
jgi:hypothetical protein